MDYFCLQTTDKNIFIYIEKQEGENYENNNFVHFSQERKDIFQSLQDLNNKI